MERRRVGQGEHDSVAVLPSRLSVQGVEFIASFEGFVDHPYNDPAGHATIGYGHLIHRGPVTQADRAKWGHITHTRGLELLHEDAAGFEACVRQVRPPIQRQARFDALVSFAYNLGCGPLQPGTGLHAALSRPDRRGVTDHLLQYTRANGHVLPGLVRRRKAEAHLWDTGRYTHP